MSEHQPRHGLYIPADENITNFSTGHHVQKVEVNERFIVVEDPWLGDEVITSPLSYDFFTTPNMQRVMGVSQLCKSTETSTIPNLADFTRAWGLFGQHLLIERILQTQPVTEDERVAYHLYAEGDDQAHLIWSHALELAVQRWGGPENYHETKWPEVAELGGTTRILDKHNVKHDALVHVPGIAIPRWVASEKPHIDVDRFQYIAAEGLLWFDHDRASPEVRERVRAALDPSNVEITPDGFMAFKNVEDALVTSKIMLLLSTEHWNEPINRTQLHLQILSAQRSIVERRLPWMDQVDKGQTRKPEYYLHAIDGDYLDAMKMGLGQRDDFLYVIRNCLTAIALEERDRFVTYKLPQYEAFILDDYARDYPTEFLPPKRVEFGPAPSSVSTSTVPYTEELKMRNGEAKLPRINPEEPGIQYTAGPLKNRYIDPLVRCRDGYRKLSELNPEYQQLLREQQLLQKLAIVVKLVFAEEYTEAFKRGLHHTEAHFDSVIARPEMTHDQRRRVIELSAERARKAALQAGTLVLKTAA